MIDLNTMMAGETLITDPSGICVVLDASKIELTDDQFFRLCRDNSDFHIEMSGKGELIIMAPNRPKTGRQHARFSYRLSAWAEQHGSGDVYDATSEFAFPNGAKRAPDASWILKTRWNALTREQQDAFPAPIVPDFVVEIRSPNDSPPRLKAKMDEYVANGVRLGWLLDPIDNRVSVYRPGEHVQEIENPTILPGDPVLPGFNFDFREIFSD